MDEAYTSRGFKSKRLDETTKNRVPPGQHATTEFPILSAGPTPQVKAANWNLALELGGSTLRMWSWTEFAALRQTTVKTDIHCVTTWSKLDTTWQGVTIDDLLGGRRFLKKKKTFAMIHCDGGYTTNLPVR